MQQPGGNIMAQISGGNRSNQQGSNKQGGGSSGNTGGASPGVGGVLDEKTINVNLTISEREAIIKQNGFRNQADVSKKLNDIKNERKMLRT